jgi:hypothetical protein
MPAKHCRVPRCKGEHEARGLCRKHYMRARKYGDPEASGPMGGPVLHPAALTAAGVNRNHADHWCRAGYLRVPLGPNGRRAWTATEVRIGVLIGQLRDAGLTIPAAAKMAREVVEGNRAKSYRFDRIAIMVGESPEAKRATRW